ncbi:hypothetical protein [Halomarina litorea]|uniref:hypothetical protein n=1 Tax=Halomarina litorea TaxID=2961595 RepID=UPI0020C2C9BC|nr:hypothetical protein [Halomarina sp. BCD28]
MSEALHRRVEVHPGCEAVVEFDPDLTFECVPQCTWCCHRGVPLFDGERADLARYVDPEAVTARVGDRDVIGREDKGREEYVDVDGRACHFLGDDGQCGLQVDHGWKPARCSVFPLSVHVEGDDLHVSLHESAGQYCEGLNVSDWRVVDHLDAFLPRALWDLPDPTTE